MTPPVSGTSKKARASSAAPKKGAASKSKRSASTALDDDRDSLAGGRDYSKRAKRSASGKKSLREEDLGVGNDLGEEEEDEGEGDENEDGEDEEDGDGGVTRCVCGDDSALTFILVYGTGRRGRLTFLFFLSPLALRRRHVVRPDDPVRHLQVLAARTLRRIVGGEGAFTVSLLVLFLFRGC